MTIHQAPGNFRTFSKGNRNPLKEFKKQTQRRETKEKGEKDLYT